MTKFRVAVDIQAPPERVWAVMRDVERWPEWTASMTSIELVDGAPLAVGARARVRQPKLPPAEMLVTELEEGKAFTWVTKSPGVRARASHEVVPIPGGARAELAVEFSGLLGGLVARMVRGLTERYMAMEAAGLKARSEAGA